MKITFSQSGPVIAALVVITLVSGCAKPIAEPDENVSTPDFFSANQWVDHDRSGGADYWEFEGANKWTYHSHEEIEFVSRIECPVGSKVSWKLRAPNGEVVDECSSEQRWASTWRRGYSGPVIELLDKAGPGVWWVQWSVNGTHVGRSAANLTQ